MDKGGKRFVKGRTAREAQNPIAKSPEKAIRVVFRSRIQGLGKRIPLVNPSRYQMRARDGILWTTIRLNSLFAEKNRGPWETKPIPGRKRMANNISGSRRVMNNSF
jgi:hypothetical protein